MLIMCSESQEVFFKDQICSDDSEQIRKAKYIVGVTKFIHWINSFPEDNIYSLGNNDRLLSVYLSGFITLSKDATTLYLGIQKREAQWLKYIPFYAACLDINKSHVGLLCEEIKIGERTVPALNLAIQIHDGWRMKQLTQLRRLCLIGVKVQYGEVVEVFDESKEIINLYHQSISSTVRENSLIKRKKTDTLLNF
jgi:hypothetical protein